MDNIQPVYKSESIIILKAEDLLYEKYKDKYFVFDTDCGYGFFHDIKAPMSKGEIFDKYNIVIKI